jgi:hypothetical protein
MIPDELRAVMHETAKMMTHANALFDRALGGIAVMHPDLVQRAIKLQVRLSEDYKELAEISGKLQWGVSVRDA